MSDKTNPNSPYASEPYLFPKWTNPALKALGPLSVIGLVAVTWAIWYWFSPKFTDMGYAPVQPVPYSHKLHAGELGIDCRYCHIGVEKTAHAQVPPTQVCMNCHAQIKGANYDKATESNPLLAPVLASFQTDLPVPWVRVHKIPDYAFFDHSRHVNRGVGCESCHGRIDQMEVVYQAQPLSMAWCLECHRSPESFLRPVDQVTKMGYTPEGEQIAAGLALKQQMNINPPQDCSGCHR